MGAAEDVMEQYPNMAWLLNDPEVGPILRDAVDPNKGFSETVFWSKIYQTNWFQTRSAARRAQETLAATDPAENARRITAWKTEVQSMANRLGVTLSEDELTWMSTQFIQEGVQPGSAEFQHKFRIWAQALPSQRFGTGNVRGLQDQINGRANQQYYVTLTDAEKRKFAVDMALGTMDQAAVDEFLSRRAQSKYGHLREQLASGATMEDLFGGHRALIAEELELDPDSINMAKQYEKVIQHYDPNSKALRPMTLSEARTLARQDQRWWQTSHGKEADATMANSLLRTFGKRA